MSGKGAQAISSSSSEILQADSGNFNSVQAARGGSSLSGSEVTSFFPQADIDCFQIEHFRSSDFHNLANMTTGGPSNNSSTIKWAPSDGCYNLFKGWLQGDIGVISCCDYFSELMTCSVRSCHLSWCGPYPCADQMGELVALLFMITTVGSGWGIVYTTIWLSLGKSFLAYTHYKLSHHLKRHPRTFAVFGTVIVLKSVSYRWACSHWY